MSQKECLIKMSESCSKIFRPWDSTKHSEQARNVFESKQSSNRMKKVASARISENDKCEPAIKTTCLKRKNSLTANHNASDEIRVPVLHQHHLMPPDMSSYVSSLTLDVPFTNTDMLIPNNLETRMHFNEITTQSTGYVSSDSLYFDSLVHSYAIEEYARILNQEHQAKLISSRKQRPKKYKCPHCDVGFSNNGQLKGHIRIHTGERPFRCDDKNCGKTFTRNEELTRHKRIHSGLRPFPCPTCGKSFGRKDHLKKHARTHMARAAGLHVVPVILPAGTWATMPPTAGVPAYNPNTYMPMFGY